MHKKWFRFSPAWRWKSLRLTKYNQNLSKLIRIEDGVKQGGFISGYLFNFYMDDLINECISLDIGCKLGNLNVSTIGYCDDLLFMANLKLHMEKLIEKAQDYALRWKIRFNPNKCVSMSTGKIKNT